MRIETIGDATLYTGCCIDVLAELPDQSVNTCITSPPYFGLRDYGNDGQIGLEGTPDAYVAKMVEVFRGVRRVLRDDGTVWLNLGDSYANYRDGKATPDTTRGDSTGTLVPKGSASNRMASTFHGSSIKHKDLIGIPWRVAFALQQPYYTGRIKNELDRVWLAAMLDAEGSICGTEYLTGDRTKTNIYIGITNTSVPIIDKCERLFPQEVKHVYEKTNGVSNRRCFRWDVERMDTKALFIREIYPYLVAKRKQAILGYTFLEMQRGLKSKKKGYLAEQHEQRSWLMAALSKLNGGEDVDMPDWAVEPPSLHETGFYLRQDIIWHKPNPMPESVTDRCTKAHEYIFLLSKNPRYYYDAEAIKEPCETAKPDSVSYRANGKSDSRKKHAIYCSACDGSGDEVDENGEECHTCGGTGLASIGGAKTAVKNEGFWNPPLSGRNRRSVWTVSTKPYKGAHFATFPPDLIEPCVMAGCPSGGVVLDPFSGSGTTGQVALEQGRKYIGIELNPEYQDLAIERITPITAQGRLFS
jgi:DNA modification methylase